VRCQRDPSCVRDDDHADLCVRIDGSVILKRRTPAEVGADFTYARDCMQRSKAIRSVALAAQDAGDSGWRDENTSPRHTVPHPNRHPEAEAQIAAAHQPPDAFETAMQTGVDDALEEQKRRRLDFLASPVTRAGLMDATAHMVSEGVLTQSEARAAIEAGDPLEEAMRRELAKQATDPGPVFAIPGSGTADYSSAPIAGTLSIGTGRQYKAVQVDTANPLDTSTFNPDDTVTRGDRTLMYADAADCEAVYLRLSHCNRPGYWANDGTLRWVDGMPPIAEWLTMHGFPREEARPKEPSVVLTGNDLDAFESFSRCAAALEEHAEQGQALQIAYRNALQAVSAMAARRNRGR
jgi:hypothetical protein